MAYKEIMNWVRKRLTFLGESNFGFGLLILWSFFEPSFWFIAADVILFLMCFSKPTNYKKLLITTIIFSTIGTIFYFLLNQTYPAQMNSILLSTPLTSKDGLSFVSGLFSSFGVWASIIQAFSSYPIKIWINVVVTNSMAFLPFLFLTIISRSIRFSFIGFVGKFLGEKLKHNDFFLLIIILIYVFLSVFLSVLSLIIF